MNPLLSPADLYHTGIVVADLTAALDELAQVGYRWGFFSDAVVAAGGPAATPSLFPDGPRDVEYRFVYSDPGPHRIELVQAMPGTIWEYDPSRAAHHLGYWCDDVERTSAALDAAGFPWTVRVGVTALGQPPAAVMHLTPSGLHIELVDRALESQLFG